MEKLMIVLACIYREDLAKCLEQNRTWMQERVEGGRRLFCGSAPLVVAKSASFLLYSLPFRLGEDPQNSISWHPLSSGVVWQILPMIRVQLMSEREREGKSLLFKEQLDFGRRQRKGFLHSHPGLLLSSPHLLQRAEPVRGWSSDFCTYKFL